MLLLGILSFIFLFNSIYLGSTETWVSSYTNPDFTITKLYFNNLLDTVINANFLLLALFTIRR